ncbi:MAG: hypothetical protein U0736_02190 [Gemmataceae bacterium]
MIDVYSVPLKELLELPGSGGHQDLLETIRNECWFVEELDDHIEEHNADLDEDDEARLPFTFVEAVAQIISGAPLHPAGGSIYGAAFEALCWGIGTTLCYVENHFNNSIAELDAFLLRGGVPLRFWDLHYAGPLLPIPEPVDLPAMGWWSPDQIARAASRLQAIALDTESSGLVNDVRELQNWLAEASGQGGDCIVGFQIDHYRRTGAPYDGDARGAGDPRDLLEVCRGDRKLRLLACAFARRVWDRLPPKARQAVEVAEQFADGLVDRPALDAARRGVRTRFAAVDKEFAPNAGAYTAFPTGCAAAYGACEATFALADGDGRGWQRDMLRDVIGEPSSRVTVDPELLAWNGGLIRGLAEAAYAERQLPRGILDPLRLRVLADAVEEAGCRDDTLLNHLRQEGAVHVRGCFAVDLLLGKR